MHHVCNEHSACLVRSCLFDTVCSAQVSDRHLFRSEIIRHGPRGDERPQGLPIPVRRIDPRHTTVKFEPRIEPNLESRSPPTYPKKNTVQTRNYQGSRSRNASPFFLRLFPPEIGAEGVGGVFGVFDFSDSSSFK